MSRFLSTLRPFVKYCIVGFSGMLVDLACLYAFVEFVHFPVLVGTSLSFTISVVSNFYLNKVWTFRSRSTNLRKLFIKFVLVALGGLVLTNFLMWFMVHRRGIWYINAKVLTTIAVLVWNFLANKYWTFSRSRKRFGAPADFPFELTVIIPAFNEAKRIPSTLRTVNAVLGSRGVHAEIIVSDDGSTDATGEVVRSLSSEIRNLSFLSADRHAGKGRAVRRGVEASRGQKVLFIDADNSTPIEEYFDLEKRMREKNADIAIGSRYLRQSRVKIRQSRLRIWIGRIGNVLIRFLIVSGICDTQCGFKLFRRDAARDIFARSKVDGWGFDIELLALARMLDYEIEEVPVSWYNSPESRLRPIRDAVRTFTELVYIKLNLWTGRYEEG